MNKKPKTSAFPFEVGTKMEKPRGEPASLPLPCDLIGLISSHLLANDVVDYIRFRAVCREWRSLTASPRSFATQFRPHRWITHKYQNHPSAPFHFHNPFTGRSLKFHLPELESPRIISSCDGLLVLVEEKTCIMRLFNPFTRHMSDDFPPLLSQFGFSNDPLYVHQKRFYLYAVTADNSPCPTVMFHIPLRTHYFAKPGDAKWECMVNYVEAVTTFKGRFYYANSNRIGLIEPEKRLVTVLIPFHYNVTDVDVTHTYFRIFDSDLLLLLKIGRSPNRYEIYRVDLESNTIEKFDNIGQYCALLIAFYGQPVLVPKKSTSR